MTDHPKRGSFSDQHMRETEAHFRRAAEERRRLTLPPDVHFYDVHIYFDAGTASEDAARALAEALGGGKRIGPIGPHPKSNYDMCFDNRTHNMEEMVNFLKQHHGNLSVLVHPCSGNELEDHTRSAIWIGQPLPLKLAALTPPQQKPPAP